MQKYHLQRINISEDKSNFYINSDIAFFKYYKIEDGIEFKCRFSDLSILKSFFGEYLFAESDRVIYLTYGRRVKIFDNPLYDYNRELGEFVFFDGHKFFVDWGRDRDRFLEPDNVNLFFEKVSVLVQKRVDTGLRITKIVFSQAYFAVLYSDSSLDVFEILINTTYDDLKGVRYFNVVDVVNYVGLLILNESKRVTYVGYWLKFPNKINQILNVSKVFNYYDVLLCENGTLHLWGELKRVFKLNFKYQDVLDVHMLGLCDYEYFFIKFKDSEVKCFENGKGEIDFDSEFLKFYSSFKNINSFVDCSGFAAIGWNDDPDEKDVLG